MLAAAELPSSGYRAGGISVAAPLTSSAFWLHGLSGVWSKKV